MPCSVSRAKRSGRLALLMIALRHGRGSLDNRTPARLPRPLCFHRYQVCTPRRIPAADRRRPVSRLMSSLATIWRLAHPYFMSEDRVAGRLVLAAVIVIELSIVGITVLINQWNNRFYNALQERNWDAFV